MGSWRLLSPILWATALVSHVEAFLISSGRIDSCLRPPTDRYVHHDLQQRRRTCPRGHTAGRAAASTSPTVMGLLRTFEPSELQLQRFIGELGFVEITDWCDVQL